MKAFLALIFTLGLACIGPAGAYAGGQKNLRQNWARPYARQVPAYRVPAGGAYRFNVPNLPANRVPAGGAYRFNVPNLPANRGPAGGAYRFNVPNLPANRSALTGNQPRVSKPMAVGKPTIARQPGNRPNQWKAEPMSQAMSTNAPRNAAIRSTPEPTIKQAPAHQALRTPTGLPKEGLRNWSLANKPRPELIQTTAPTSALPTSQGQPNTGNTADDVGISRQGLTATSPSTRTDNKAIQEIKRPDWVQRRNLATHKPAGGPAENGNLESQGGDAANTESTGTESKQPSQTTRPVPRPRNLATHKPPGGPAENGNLESQGGDAANTESTGTESKQPSQTTRPVPRPRNLATHKPPGGPAENGNLESQGGDAANTESTGTENSNSYEANAETGPGSEPTQKVMSVSAPPNSANAVSEQGTAEIGPAQQFQQNRRIQGSDQWVDSDYDVFRDYRSEWHDRNWWRTHQSRIVFGAGGWYYWKADYWFPAWGYDPAADYAYDGPIYAYNDFPPDQVIAKVQGTMQQQGYYEGESDGLLGSPTSTAIANYQRAHGLYETATIDRPTLQSLGMK